MLAKKEKLSKSMAKSKRFNNLVAFSIVWTLSLVAMPAFAALKPEKHVPTIGEIAERFIIGTDFLTRLMLVASVAVGAMLVVTSITYFRAHRVNPKLAPLDRPLYYLVLGLVLIALPFFGDIFGPTGSVLELKKQEKAKTMSAPLDIDAPLELGNEYDH